MSISLGQAIRNGIETERAAALFYSKISQKVLDPRLAKFFSELVRAEEQHARDLENLAARLGADLPLRPDEMIDLVETAPAWSDSENISIRQALELAAESEKHAALYYSAMADQCSGEVARLFAERSQIEEKHAQMLEDLIAQL